MGGSRGPDRGIEGGLGPPPDLAGLVALKRSKQLRISVCLPALDEAATIGAICTTIVSELMAGDPLVDQLLVVDSGSTDGTVEIARSAGAEVHAADAVLPEMSGPRAGGKGEALWKALALAHGEIVVYVDSDLRNFEASFVSRLVAPLVEDDSLVMVKAFYDRPLVDASGARVPGGARVTELVARPLINLFYPELRHIVQPLSGEYAARREALLDLPYMTGYGVEIGLLLDAAERFGVDAIGQVDLGIRTHQNQEVAALGRMAFQVMTAAVWRLEQSGRLKTAGPMPAEILQFDAFGPDPTGQVFEVGIEERPPMRTVLEDG